MYKPCLFPSGVGLPVQNREPWSPGLYEGDAPPAPQALISMEMENQGAEEEEEKIVYL